jgi:urease accessory protein
MIILRKIFRAKTDLQADFTLCLTAQERQRSRQKIRVDQIINGQKKNQLFVVDLPRGTVLNQNDLLTTEEENFIVLITAKKEPVITITAANNLALIRAAYHLGNRHVSLEINKHYLRLSFDPILASMLTQLGLQIKEELAPFFPEIGAYSHSHDH